MAVVGSEIVTVDVELGVTTADVGSELVTADDWLRFVTADELSKLDIVEVRRGFVSIVIESDVEVESKFTAELELATAGIGSKLVPESVELGLVTADVRPELVTVYVGLELFTTDVRADFGVLLKIVEIGSVPTVDVCSEAFLATDDASKLVVVSELVVSAVVGSEFFAMEGEGVGRSSAKSFRSSIDDSSKMK